MNDDSAAAPGARPNYGYEDLRDLIDRFDDMGELARVDGADWNLEIGAVSETVAAENPGRAKAVLFDNIAGYPQGFRILSGGTNAFRPGRCLDLMGEHGMKKERDDFLEAYCRAPEGQPGDFTDCNVDVTAFDEDGDELNDSWTIKAENATGLICGFQGREFFVYGVVEGVSFEIDIDAGVLQ